MRPRTIGRQLQTARDIFADGVTADAELTGNGSNLQALPVKFRDHDKFPEFDHRAPPSLPPRGAASAGIAPTRLSDFVPEDRTAASKLGKIQSPQMGRIHRPLKLGFASIALVKSAMARSRSPLVLKALPRLK